MGIFACRMFFPLVCISPECYFSQRRTAPFPYPSFVTCQMRDLCPCWKSASFSVINPLFAREIIDWEDWSVSPCTPHISSGTTSGDSCAVCGRDYVKNTSPSFSLVPDKDNGESPCTTRYFLCTVGQSGNFFAPPSVVRRGRAIWFCRHSTQSWELLLKDTRPWWMRKRGLEY